MSEETGCGLGTVQISFSEFEICDTGAVYTSLIDVLVKCDRVDTSAFVSSSLDLCIEKTVVLTDDHFGIF